MIFVNEPLLDGDEKKNLIECIETGWISSEGPFVKGFEQRMCELTDRKYAISVCNGTVALDLAVDALGFQEGDEIIMPTFTIISCINQVIRLGLKPVFIDSDINTWNMDITQIESKITSKTKAIMVVHIYGLPVDMDPILELAKKHNLKIIEDSAQMHGQTYKNRPCGSFGDISTFSFYPNKHITTGEGGMVLTNSPELYERLKMLRNLCFEPSRRFMHEDLGYNARMTNLQAAVGVAQIKRLATFVEKKREIGKIYNELLADMQDFIQLPLKETSYAKNIYWVYGIVLRKNIELDIEYLTQKLKERGVETRPFFFPLHKQPFFKKQGMFVDETYPVAEYIAEKGFYLPSGLGTDLGKIKEAGEIFKAVFLDLIGIK